MIKSVLVANRGEIACRIMRTLRRLGIRSIAIYHFADRRAPHVLAADEAYEIESTTPTAAYLDIAAILAIAHQSDSDAIHPGYGFLAENQEFAAAIAEAGRLFIGPNADVIELMGDKIRAREFATSCGVPVVPGITHHDPAELIKNAQPVGFPMLIKAAAGGGGKGMSIARDIDDLRQRLVTAQAEAKRYFLDDRLFIERYIERPRHIEVQVLGDGHGNVIHLFERECSVQRRYQKIIEEAPAPNLPESLRDSICEAAVAMCKTANYLNAGTVEFILAPDGEFYFLEMNTRLQVEHPVTELVTGLDIVEEQILITQNNELRLAQNDVTQTGHAIECRICAEIPTADFRPSTGRIGLLEMESSDHVRLDSGIAEGQEIGASFDSMLAKLVGYGTDRDTAIEHTRQSLRQMVLLGLETNIEYLARILDHDVFRKAELHTGFLTEHAPDLISDALSEHDQDALLIAAALATHDFRKLIDDVPLPHRAIGHWRN